MGKTISLKNITEQNDKFVRFGLVLQGFTAGEQITLEVWEIDENQDYRKHGERQLGTITGTVQQPDSSKPEQFLSGAKSTVSVTFLESPFLITTDQGSGSEVDHGFSPVGTGETDEGDSWEIQLRLKGDKSVHSPTWYIARYQRRIPSTQATYDWHQYNGVEFYNDASTDKSGSGGYFHDLKKAIGEAKHFIFVADWSFHPYALLKPGDTKNVGEILVEWANGHTDGFVAIHTWDHTGVGAADDQNDDGEAIFKNEIKKPSNMYWRMSSRTGEDGAAGFGWSHHQKFVVLDCPCEGDDKNRRTIKAFIGGIDLTQGRFDWPDHPFLPADSLCENFRKITSSKRSIHDWYNLEFSGPPMTTDGKAVLGDNDKTFPRQPWHDIHCQVTGPTAWDVVREFIGRWNVDPAWRPNEAEGDTDDTCIKALQKLFTDVFFDKTKFVQQWEPQPKNGIWKAQILRSITKDHWGSKNTVKTPAKHVKDRTEFEWSITSKVKERSIQDAYLRTIAQAERFIYIETQYFIGSGSKWAHSKRTGVKNEIPEALANRIIAKAKKNENFHVYLIVPMFPEGDPSSSANQAQRDFQWQSIEHIIRSIENAKIGDWQKYFTVGFLANWSDLSSLGRSLKTSGNRIERVRENQRYMIYVHSKMMIVDDRYAIIGSANLNERSQAGGRDSEICVAVWPMLTKEAEARDQMRNFRKRLWLEHFGGLTPGWETPETRSCSSAVQKIGTDNWNLLSKGKHSDSGQQKKGHFCCWPIDGSKDGLDFRGQNKLIVDGLTGPIIGDDWYLWPTGYADLGDIAE